MDDPRCDPVRLRNTYAQFALVNRLLSGWRVVFERGIRPRARAGGTVLDVGCGGGDVARALWRWSREAGIPLEVTGVDPDPRALAFARGTVAADGGGPRFERADLAHLRATGRRFDFVVSNHVLHHLDPRELGGFLEDTAAIAATGVLHNDLRRSDLAYLAFALVSWPMRRSYIAEDGLRSVRRAYTPAELRGLAPPGWRVERLEPFRSLLRYDA